MTEGRLDTYTLVLLDSSSSNQAASFSASVFCFLLRWPGGFRHPILGEAVVDLVVGHELLVNLGEPGIFDWVQLIYNAILRIGIGGHPGHWVLLYFLLSLCLEPGSSFPLPVLPRLPLLLGHRLVLLALLPLLVLFHLSNVFPGVFLLVPPVLHHGQPVNIVVASAVMLVVLLLLRGSLRLRLSCRSRLPGLLVDPGRPGCVPRVPRPTARLRVDTFRSLVAIATF